MDDAQDGYLAFSTAPVEIDGHPFTARVHWAQVNGSARVVGVDLRTYWVDGEDHALRDLYDAQPPVSLEAPGWGEVGARTVRGLAVGSVIQQSRQTLQDDPRWESVPDPIRQAAQDVLSVQPPRRPGPQHVVPEAVLAEVVAPAYLRGGRHTTRAVQEALGAAGYGDKGPGSLASPDRAKKAVRRARDLGLIAPAERKGKP